MNSFAPSLRIIEAPAMTITKARKLGWTERLRAWLENLADSADLIYPFRRVRRHESVPDPAVIVCGSIIYAHPATVRKIRTLAERQILVIGLALVMFATGCYRPERDRSAECTEEAEAAANLTVPSHDRHGWLQVFNQAYADCINRPQD